MKIGIGNDESFVSKSLPQLKPWRVHEVSFEGFTNRTVDGKKDPAKKYHILSITFKNDEGQYVHDLFLPQPGDEKRGTRTNDKGVEVETPSRVDTFVKTIGHVLNAVAPELLDKLKGKDIDVEKLALFLEKESKQYVGRTTKIKLVADNEGRPRFPYFLNIFEPGKAAVVTNNFCGLSVGFTPYELERKKNQETAKPSKMEEPSDESDPLDFDL